MRLGLVVCICAGALACLRAGPSRGASIPSRRAARPSSSLPSLANLTRARDALESLRAHVVTGDPAALTLVGLSLAVADGAREMTGEPASDERVERSLIVNDIESAATMLVTTTCGNALLASMRWVGGRWIAATQLVLVAEMRPGRCGQTAVRAQALRLASDIPRELAVVVTTEDATGETVRGPFLSVFQLGADARLVTLLSAAPFGSTDDATGATTQGEFLVVDDVPSPRDLHVSIRPGRPGLVGGTTPEIVRRRYALVRGRLEMTEEHREACDQGEGVRPGSSSR